MKIPQTLLTGTILAGVGVYKTAKDYIIAPKEQKTRTLIRNTTSLTIATGVVFSADKVLLKYLSSKNLQTLIHNSSSKIITNKYIQKTLNFINPKIKFKPLKLELLSDIITNSIQSASLLSLALFSGVFSGIATDKILKKIRPERIEKINNFEFRNNNLNKSFNKISDHKVIDKLMTQENKTLFLNAADLIGTTGIRNNPLDKPFVIMHGISMVGEEQNLKKILEQSATGILTEAIIPTIFISAANSLTKNKKCFIRFSSIASSFCVGNILGNNIGQRLTQEV